MAKITGMRKGRLCGEDAFRRLYAPLDASQVEAWFAPAEQMIHHVLPHNAVADWDSTVVVRYPDGQFAINLSAFSNDALSDKPIYFR